MVLNQKAQLMEMEMDADKAVWNPVKAMWVNTEKSSKSNLFSRVGIGAKTMLFTTAKRKEITLHNALLMNKQFYFITDIVWDNGPLMQITTAIVTPVTCEKYSRHEALDAYKRPIYSAAQPVLTFPGILTEKYIGFKQLEPQAQTETTFVLVVPKMIALAVSDLVSVNGQLYAVHVAHELDDYKNEYEISKAGDV